MITDWHIGKEPKIYRLRLNVLLSQHLLLSLDSSRTIPGRHVQEPTPEYYSDKAQACVVHLKMLLQPAKPEEWSLPFVVGTIIRLPFVVYYTLSCIAYLSG